VAARHRRQCWRTLLAPLVREAPTTISSFDIAMMSSVVDLVSFVLGGRRRPLKCFGDPGYAVAEFKVDRIGMAFAARAPTRSH
jgi:hypothetical protein